LWAAKLQLFCKPLVCVLARVGLQMCYNVRWLLIGGAFFVLFNQAVNYRSKHFLTLLPTVCSYKKLAISETKTVCHHKT